MAIFNFIEKLFFCKQDEQDEQKVKCTPRIKSTYYPTQRNTNLK